MQLTMKGFLRNARRCYVGLGFGQVEIFTGQRGQGGREAVLLTGGKPGQVCVPGTGNDAG